MMNLSDIPPKGGSPFTLPMAAFLMLLLLAPFLVARFGLYHYLAIEIAIWIIFAMGFNLLFGYTGLHSFGHGAYLGIGAYAFGLFQHNVSTSLWGGLGAALLAAMVAGGFVALFLSHRRGIYFALLSIAFGQIFWFSSIKLHRVTGGEDGLLGIPRPPLQIGNVAVTLADNRIFYWFVAALAALVVIGLWRVVNSPFGRVLQAIRQNEMRARFVGYDVWRWKWLAFTISATFAGLAGALLAMAQNSAYPDVMSLHQSGLVVMMVLVGGGLVNFWGPILGVLLYFLAREVLGSLTETWLLWYGLMFVVMVMVRPEGLAGLIGTAARREAPAPPARIVETTP
ncbi:MAG: branched-chain amino acid ABC transporter permease [Beijerinckiaceae bacterium]|nr:branched-chain amino acid ABC transporter permease [Beijerinckiaceae bacterium]MCZ8300252.1 branched-chain amino acid ABC transporter permease [Beijerinckiaceae bacterium]